MRQARQELEDAGFFPFRHFNRFSGSWRRQFFQGVAFACDADFDVLARCFDVGVAEPFLDHSYIASGFNQMERGGVAEDMRCDL